MAAVFNEYLAAVDGAAVTITLLATKATFATSTAMSNASG
jgi:hypothetical protein